MIDNQRFRKMMEYLKTNRYIRNQQDFTERVKSDKATVSQVMNDHINIPNIMFGNIAVSFPFISTEWLKTGEGEMIKGSVSQTSHGDNSPNINGNSNHLETTSSLLDKALDEIAAMRCLLEKSIQNNKEQADRFFAVVERMQGV